MVSNPPPAESTTPETPKGDAFTAPTRISNLSRGRGGPCPGALVCVPGSGIGWPAEPRPRGSSGPPARPGGAGKESTRTPAEDRLAEITPRATPSTRIAPARWTRRAPPCLIMALAVRDLSEFDGGLLDEL